MFRSASPTSSAPSAAGRLPRRGRLLIEAAVVIVVLLAWAYLFYLARRMGKDMAAPAMSGAMAMAGMPMSRPWGATDLLLNFVMWVVMMVGMMAGSALPVLLLFAAAHRRRHQYGASLTISAFGAGYLAVWTAFSLAATLAQWALHDTALLSPAMAAADSRLAGAILVAAGIYQLTPYKAACLSHCRSPLGFLMGHWRDGAGGAFSMGSTHGFYCLGCCWALMAVLFAVGVMNLAWVAALTVFVLLEKTGPAGIAAARAGGVLLIGFGIYFLIFPLPSIS